MSKYYNMQLAESGRKAEIMIFGDITSCRWLENDVSSYSFARELEKFGNVDEIIVHINSYGGEVAEAYAVYNTLRNHPAKVTTITDGFSCSAASLIFMAGERRIMNPLSALWIHEVQFGGYGNAKTLRKIAEETENLNKLSKLAYTSADLKISEAELDQMLDSETWIFPETAVEMGFATEIAELSKENAPTQSAKTSLFELLKLALEEQRQDEPDTPDEPDKPDKPDTPDEPDKPDEPDTPDEPDEPDEPDKPDTPDPPDSPDNPDDPDDPDKDENAAQQKWSGFFHALMTM